MFDGIVVLLCELEFVRGIFLNLLVSRFIGLAGDSPYGPIIAEVGVCEVVVVAVVVNFDDEG